MRSGRNAEWRSGSLPGVMPAPGSPPRVYLLGLMGSGKSSVGEQLAALLDCPYLDNDELLLAGSGESLQSLAAAGADTLHAAESAHTRQVCAVPPPFVAGIAASVADRPEDIALLQATGTVVYLRSSPETIAGRLGSGEGRPWFDGNPLPVLEQMFAARDGVFARAADLTVESDDEDARIVAGRIAAAISPAG